MALVGLSFQAYFPLAATEKWWQPSLSHVDENRGDERTKEWKGLVSLNDHMEQSGQNILDCSY